MINTVIFVAERRKKAVDKDNFINCVPSVIPKGILNASPCYEILAINHL